MEKRFAVDAADGSVYASEALVLQKQLALPASYRYNYCCLLHRHVQYYGRHTHASAHSTQWRKAEAPKLTETSMQAPSQRTAESAVRFNVVSMWLPVTIAKEINALSLILQLQQK